jgi:redox-sensitive bicupin YhaK (pirin superfamily)
MDKTSVKRVTGVRPASAGHWVGDGFPVRSFFDYGPGVDQVSPFLMLDYAAPAEFGPAPRPRGVGEHPHRGFETVTVVYQGSLEHRDSTGAGGRIGPGDVQWMTAGAGILHEEFHSSEFTREGGTLEMAQLWVNLPARDKGAPPGYQTILDGDIPSVALPGDAGRVRVIAGEYAGARGPARTFTPIDLWDVRLQRGGRADLDFAEGRTVALAVLRGTIEVNGEKVVRAGETVVFERERSQVSLEANGEATLLVLSGEPIAEPVVGYGPFVMNSPAEIRQAIEDFNGGRFGRMEPPTG